VRQASDILSQQSSFEQFCSQFDWYDFKILGSFLTKLDHPLDTTTQSLHSIWRLFRRRGIGISKMTVCRRLKRFTIVGLLSRLPKTNPAFYEITKGQEQLVKRIVYFKRTEELMEL
jgi:Fe2+ or Zn2+ uptake regulation protein